jgi:hypothetical protein
VVGLETSAFHSKKHCGPTIKSCLWTLESIKCNTEHKFLKQWLWDVWCCTR